MKAKAGICYEEGKPFTIEEIDVDEPKAGEVLIKMVASGLCHSDYHLITGDYGPGAAYLPMIGGHEGAGIIERVGPGVTEFAPGGHVLMSFLPTCGQCAYCGMGQSAYCERGGRILKGPQMDRTFRAKNKTGQELGQFAMLGTFANWAVVPVMSCIKLHEAIPVEKICVMGCCVPTGFGSATKAAGTRFGEVVVVYGIGGIGANALQGAAAAGARMIIAVDPVPFKREIAKTFGATHTIDPTTEDVFRRVMQLTYNRGTDRAVVTIGNPVPEDIALAVKSLRKAGGRLVITAVTHTKYTNLPISLYEFAMLGKQMVGTVFGDLTVREDIPRLLEMYSAGRLKIDELTTKTYPLEKLNEGYQDMLDGKNIRGVVIHEH